VFMNIYKIVREQGHRYGNRQCQGENETPNPVVPTVLDKMEVEVTKNPNGTWAVFVNGEILCGTPDRRGAYAVQGLLDRVWQAYCILKDEVGFDDKKVKPKPAR
jgi:hypothetical protein